MANEDLRALLLEDYRYRATGMASSEQSGETRINLFIGLITFCAGAIGAAYIKGQAFGLGHLHQFALAVALALLAIGIVILCRMAIRNEHTDLAKEQLDLIRQTFKDHFDDSGALVQYDLFPKSGGRKFGGLTDLVAVVNGIIAAAVVVIGFLVLSDKPQVYEGHIAALAVGVFVLSFCGQRSFIRTVRDEYKNRHDAHFNCTHAGGVVYSERPRRYLIVNPSNGKADEWVLPKGHIEKGEHPIATAVREVGEETGIFAKVVAELPSISFSLNNDMEPTRVRFYLMVKVGSVTMPKNKKEKRGIEWVSVDKAEKMLTFKESRGLLRRADQIISKLH